MVPIAPSQRQLDLLARLTIYEKSGRLGARVRNREVALKVKDALVAGINKAGARGQGANISPDGHDRWKGLGVDEDLPLGK